MFFDYFCKDKPSITYMKRFILTLAIVLMSASCVWSQLLWRVDGNGLSRPSYLMGTHHFAPKDFIDKVGGLDEAINACDVVYGELKMNDQDTDEYNRLLMLAMVAPPDSTLDKVLSADEFAVVDAIVRKYLGIGGVTLQKLVNFKPAGLSTNLQALQAQKYFPLFDPTKQIDQMVQKRAEALGKASCGLETIEEQIDILFNTPISYQAEGLVDMCRNDDKYEKATSMLADAYVAQDLDAMLKLLVAPEYGMTPTDEELDRLVWNRNRKWVDLLVSVFPEKSVLVCVGAGHLPGDKGLIALLRGAGYTVTPVSK